MASSGHLINEEVKDLLLSRVQELVFVDGVAGFECRRCERILIRHYSSNCGHKFCLNCKKHLGQENSKCPLPSCKQPIEEMEFQDIDFEQKLYDLRAHCLNRKYGCPFVSQLKDLGDHLKICKDTKDRVFTKGNSSLEMVLRELSKKFDNLSSDVNKMKEDIKTEVDEKMKNIEVNVDNNIKALKLEMDKKMSDMIKTCKLDIEKENKAEVDIKLKNMRSVLQTSLTNNEKMVQDVELLKLETSKIITKITESFLLIKNPQMSCCYLVNGKSTLQPDFSWKLSGIKNIIEQKTFEMKSEVFKWSDYLVQSCAKLELKHDDIVYLSLEDLNKEVNDIRLIPTVYCVLKDQSGNSAANHWSRSKFYLFTTKFNDVNSLNFEQPFFPKSWLINHMYNVNDSIVIDIYVEPPSMTQLVHSYDGTLNYAIDNYHMMREMASKQFVEYHESPYFYTGPQAYRMQVKMWLNGYGEHAGKGLTVQISFVTSEFDDDLPLTFPHQVTITLINRKEPDKCITKTVESDIADKLESFVDMCSHEDIDTFIDNDILFYNVVIIKSINI